MFPGEMKKAFAQVVKAQKDGQAALEKARGETAALRSLANAARMMDDNPNLLQLRAFASSRGFWREHTRFGNAERFYSTG